MKQYFGTLNRPLYYIYISVQSGGFPEEMKIARVTPIFKGGEVSDLGNYRSISVDVAFLKFSKKLCIIVFTNICLIITYFIRNNLDFKKIIQLITQLFN